MPKMFHSIIHSFKNFPSKKDKKKIPKEGKNYFLKIIKTKRSVRRTRYCASQNTITIN